MDLKLTADGDLDITNGRLSWVTGVNATVQRVRPFVRTFLRFRRGGYGPDRTTSLTREQVSQA